LVIPKRLARHAVLRNLIKRQVREVFRRQCHTLPAADIVVRLSRWPVDKAAIGRASPALKLTLRLELGELLDQLRQRTMTIGHHSVPEA
jgi:ribonuclease P protein component